MNIERRHADVPREPFPIYPAIVSQLLAAHTDDSADTSDSSDTACSGRRDPTTAHILAMCSGYAAADLATMATMMERLGLGGSACVRIQQVVDAMLIFATAYIVQSACGRVVIVCFRGTEPANIGNWLGDADVGPATVLLGSERMTVHAGFQRNLRAIRLSVLEELGRATEGRSLVDHARHMDHKAEAIFVTGHSLGGAMAALFAIGLESDPAQRAVRERMRAIYTYGQPMVATQPLPMLARTVGRNLYRHVMPHDIVPSLPPVGWGCFVHFGNEYMFTNGAWSGSDTRVVRAAHVRQVTRTLLRSGTTPARRADAPFDVGAHLSHHYIAALRPPGVVTEFGDFD